VHWQDFRAPSRVTGAVASVVGQKTASGAQPTSGGDTKPIELSNLLAVQAENSIQISHTVLEALRCGALGFPRLIVDYGTAHRSKSRSVGNGLLIFVNYLARQTADRAID
jgi:hypothetical protein